MVAISSRAKKKRNLPRGHAKFITQVQQKRIRAGHTKFKLKELAKVANEHHHKSKRLWQEALKEAKLAGDALCQARALHKKRGTWQKWLDDNFVGSYPTARVYMRVSKKWNEPEVKAERNRGNISSLNTFLAFTSTAKATPPLGPGSPVQTEEDFLRERLRQFYTFKLKQLKRDLLNVLDEDPDTSWDRMIDEAKFELLPGYIQNAIMFSKWDDEPGFSANEARESEADDRRVFGRCCRCVNDS